MQKIPKDPIMCLSFVNTQLRDAYNSLEELCRAFDVKKEERRFPADMPLSADR